MPMIGRLPAGLTVGVEVGVEVGVAVAVGDAVVADAVGDAEVGEAVGDADVGDAVGEAVGEEVGVGEGERVGLGLLVGLGFGRRPLRPFFLGFSAATAVEQPARPKTPTAPRTARLLSGGRVTEDSGTGASVTGVSGTGAGDAGGRVIERIPCSFRPPSSVDGGRGKRLDEGARQ
jgi:hypothetical protein